MHDQDQEHDQAERWEPTPESYEARDRHTQFERAGNVLVAIRRELFDFFIPSKLNGDKLKEGCRTMTLWFDGGQWKCCIRAKDASAVAFVTAPSLQELLSDLQQRMRKETLKWKEDLRK